MKQVGDGLVVVRPSVIELAWAGGFFDGEGCIYTRLARSRQPAPALSVRQASTADGQCPDTLLRFARAVGVGRINGPYRHKATVTSPQQAEWKPYYNWSVESTQAGVAIRALWPYIGEAKRAAGAPWIGYYGRDRRGKLLAAPST